MRERERERERDYEKLLWIKVNWQREKSFWNQPSISWSRPRYGLGECRYHCSSLRTPSTWSPALVMNRWQLLDSLDLKRGIIALRWSSIMGVSIGSRRAVLKHRFCRVWRYVVSVLFRRRLTQAVEPYSITDLIIVLYICSAASDEPFLFFHRCCFIWCSGTCIKNL